MNILITLCARGGSKGIPGKNIMLINDKPLIVYSIELAKTLFPQHKVDISLSTDDDSIVEVAENWGVKTEYIRPSELATDTAGKIATIKHLLMHEENDKNVVYDYVLDLDISSPLRTKKDIESAFQSILSDPEALTLFSVNPSHRNPYFNMVEKNEEGYYDLVKKSNKIIKSRQTSPKVFDLNASFYWYSRAFFDKEIETPITTKSLIYEMDHICFDLDTSDDVLFLRFLLENNKLKGLL